MKQRISRLLAGVMVFTAIVAMGCSKHEHVYVEEIVEPTCLQEGYNQFVCECGDSYKGENVLAKTAHKGMVNCLNCQLNYYDEIKQLIIDNGQIGDNGKYYYIGENRSTSLDSQQAYVCYNPSTMSIYLGLFYDLTLLQSEYSFTILIEHPTEGTGLETGKYTWCLSLSDNSLLGVVNGATFSSATTSLSVEYNDGFSNAALSSAKSLAASLANNAIEDGFIPLLKLGTKGVTPANFGFLNYKI